MRKLPKKEGSEATVKRRERKDEYYRYAHAGNNDRTGIICSKISYVSRSAAKRALRKVKADGIDSNPSIKMETYQCHQCNLFHIGHRQF